MNCLKFRGFLTFILSLLCRITVGIRPQIILLFLIPGSIWAQEDNYTKLSVGLTFTPGISHRLLENNDSKRDDAESSQFRMGVGFQFYYFVSNSFGISGGLGLAPFSYKIPTESWDYIYFGSQIDPTTGILYSSQQGKPDDMISRYQWDYFEIPLNLILKSTFSKLNITSSIGFSYGILINENFDYFQGQSNHGTVYIFKKSNLFLNISLGSCYRLNRRLELSLSPKIKYGLITISNAPNSVNLYHIGVDAGIKYFLK